MCRCLIHTALPLTYLLLPLHLQPLKMLNLLWCAGDLSQSRMGFSAPRRTNLSNNISSRTCHPAWRYMTRGHLMHGGGGLRRARYWTRGTILPRGWNLGLIHQYRALTRNCLLVNHPRLWLRHTRLLDHPRLLLHAWLLNHSWLWNHDLLLLVS